MIFYTVVCYGWSNFTCNLLHVLQTYNKQAFDDTFVWHQESLNSSHCLPVCTAFNIFLYVVVVFSLFLSFSALLCVWAEFSAPVMKLNFSPLNQSEMVWSANKRFSLSCDGQADIIWKTRRRSHQKTVSRNVLTVLNPTADHTGTYSCSYKNQKDLYSEIHIYVKGMCTIKI